MLGLTLAIATWTQVGLGLRPLDALRRGVADIRSGRRHHLPAEVPSEVRPLVEEINALLDGQEREIDRSRSRAADLAHGLRHPWPRLRPMQHACVNVVRRSLRRRSRLSATP